MPRALARSAYGTSRRIGDAGISVARLESLTLLNGTPITFALRVQLLVRHRHAPTPASGGHQIKPSNPNPSTAWQDCPPNIPELPIRASAETASMKRFTRAILSNRRRIASRVCVDQERGQGDLRSSGGIVGTRIY